MQNRDELYPAACLLMSMSKPMKKPLCHQLKLNK